MGNVTGYRRYLLLTLYGLLVLGALLLFVGSRAAGTILVVGAVIGVVGVSVTGRTDE